MVPPLSPGIADPQAFDENERRELAEAIRSPLFIADLLLERGIKDKETARAFFLAAHDEDEKPAPLKGLEAAVAALLQAKADGQKVVVHGDYDVDGVTGTALLYLGLRELGFACGWFIPNRFREGYGISRQSLDQIRADGGNLVVSVDTGIVAVEEIAYANSLGLRVIVTDHHQAGEALPPALAILNPNQPGCPHPNKCLAGVGVAYVLLAELCRHLPGCNAEEFLELVALGSLADNVPVTGANRPLIRQGLRRLPQTRLPGVRALFEKVGVPLDGLTTMDLLFKVTPLLNAMGRMGSPEISLRLLLSENKAEADGHLQRIVEENAKRRALDQAITEEAIRRIEADPSLCDAPCIVVGDAGWHEGVIGIVAARLVDRYARPAFVLALDAEGRGKGSGRTVTGFHLHKALGTVSHLFEKWGGHYYACGFSIKAGKMEEFRDAMEKLAAEFLGEAQGPGPLQPAAYLPLHDLHEESMLWLRRFEPFGPHNETPLFCTDEVTLSAEPRVVGERHLKFTVTVRDGQIFDAIAFNLGHLADDLRTKRHLRRIAFHPEWNTFRGRKKIQLRVVALE